MTDPVTGGSGNSTTPQTTQNRCYQRGSAASAPTDDGAGNGFYVESASRGYGWNKVWRERHPDKRHRWKNAYRARTGSGSGPRLGTRWMPDEDAAVLDHAIPDRELAEQLGRSVQAIAVRRARLKKRAPEVAE